jgi:hypothetical protein
MLKKAASSVLASLRGSTYRSVRLASSLAAALLDDLFEPSAWVFPYCAQVGTSKILVCQSRFFPAFQGFSKGEQI